MKIAIDISQIVYKTGVSKYTEELINYLPKDQILPFKVSPMPITLAEWWGNIVHQVDLENFLEDFDVYHSSDWIQFPCKAKKVTTVHDLSPFLFPQETDPKIVKVHTRKMKWVVEECDKIICVSQSTASDLQRLFKVISSRIVIIPEALPTSRLHLVPKPVLGDYVVAIGARQPRKNINRLKKACEILHKKLVIIGEGSTLGHVSDQELVNYLSGASVFVYPSLYEGFGLPILEAFHFKVPVVASNVSSIPEVAGNAAILVDPYNEEEIAHGIATAIKNRAKLITAGTKQLSRFSWEKTAQQTLQVYKSLL